ncbi:hypothetical protein D5S18_09310 [Nocardia panacis]|uniref:Mammalian cell entry protein n=2 Tax=Nocardia panacis TaxID=2340916 RepID=A0A3A4K635_9NOCA|nr:hypothetical protein D5S18_09310 [Nocardia panacis]
MTKTAEAPPDPVPAAARPFDARRVATIVVGVALVLALAAACWFGIGWARAAFFTDGPRAAAREAALDGARQTALNMTTTNLADVPGTTATQRSSMAGALLDSATKNQPRIEAEMVSAAVNTTSKVVGSALTELDSELDRAAALVVLRVTETRKDQPPASYRYTWSLNMVKVGDIWKAEQVASLENPVPLGADAAPASPAAPPANQGTPPANQAPQPAVPGNPPAAPKPGS